MSTDVFNHGPAKLFMNTGFQATWTARQWERGPPMALAVNPLILPGFVVLQSQVLVDRAPEQFPVVQRLPADLLIRACRSVGKGDPILQSVRSPQRPHHEQREAAISTIRCKRSLEPGTA